eukprot:NODE_4308_length_794_cov_69.842579_g4285_i0.p1 GENE.NODE_4308_length_794_cov_69.842579_g4285_i0~~NODE_4308_length_794_cov_69.842579_g4285_i0.p1  ORF type:complete len:163 (-),score=19.48 NODE_4308_length_794_cov_69.842579_g4285_i0:304-732(-)
MKTRNTIIRVHSYTVPVCGFGRTSCVQDYGTSDAATTQGAQPHRVPASGTGLGLAICTQFVQQMRGGLNVVSVVGKGTSISFSVPFKHAGAGAAVCLVAAGSTANAAFFYAPWSPAPTTTSGSVLKRGTCVATEFTVGREAS